MADKDTQKQVSELLAKKFETIQQINLRKAEVAKIHADLARLGMMDRIPAIAAW